MRQNPIFLRITQVGLYIACLLCALANAASPSSPPFAAPAGKLWQVVPELSDEFNGRSIDANKWYDYHPNWSGRAPSQFKKGNAFVSGGYLNLRTTSRINSMSEVSRPYDDIWVDAAAVVSKQKMAQVGWYYETSFKASDTAMSSSFWFRMGKFSEIDVIEHIGHGTLGNAEKKAFSYESNTHVYGTKSGPSVPKSWVMSTRGRDAYHRYGLYWRTATQLDMYHNGTKVMTIVPSVGFDEKLNMIFDTETLASKFVGLPTIASLKDNNRNTMKVDWVKTWKLIDATNSSTSSSSTSSTTSSSSSSANSSSGDVDQCNTTSQCRTTYGAQATDCKNSSSNTSVCMCGAERCDAGLSSSSSTTSSTSSGGVYPLVTLRKSNHQSYAIDGGNGGRNGQNITLWSYTASSVNQQWVEIGRGSGFYSYKKKNTNYCIDGGNGGANGQVIYLWACNTGNQNQHWRKVPLGGNNYRLEKRNASSYSIDGNNGGSNGQKIYLWSSNNNNENQNWIFTQVGTSN